MLWVASTSWLRGAGGGLVASGGDGLGPHGWQGVLAGVRRPGCPPEGPRAVRGLSNLCCHLPTCRRGDTRHRNRLV